MWDPFDGNRGSGKSRPFSIARVKKIILGPYLTETQVDPDYTSEKDIGAIRYELLYQGKTNVKGSKNNSKKAYAMSAAQRQYPNVGEIVMLISGPSSNLNDNSDAKDLYYFSPFSIFNSPHHNVFPNMQEFEDHVNNQLVNSNTNADAAKLMAMPQGVTFEERDSIKTLRPFEGDTVFQGRWGQSIRFGSTVSELKNINTWSSKTENGKNGDPITIIVNSQKTYNKLESESPTTVEDINRDGSSIYMTSGQAISVSDISLYRVRSYSLSTASDPQTRVVIVPEKIPTSNEYLSADDQDTNSINGQTAGRALVNRGDIG
jgi:hypothetical protein